MELWEIPARPILNTLALISRKPRASTSCWKILIIAVWRRIGGRCFVQLVFWAFWNVLAGFFGNTSGTKAGAALVKWAQRHGSKPAVLESYTQIAGNWQDYVAVFLKDESCTAQFPQRILDSKVDFENGQRMSDDALINFTDICQHDRMLQATERVAAEKNSAALRRVDELAAEIAQLKKTETELADLKLHIQKLQSTMSWRLTAPFRTLKKVLIK